jgi:hypothetical protein
MLPVLAFNVETLRSQSSNGVGDAGACAFGDGLNSNNSLQTLDLVSFRVSYLFVER